MNHGDAEEYTQALGQVAAGAWRQVALGERLGVPTALGLSTREWVEERLGGYVRMGIPERREAVAELVAEGMTQREVADVLGVDAATVNRDVANATSDAEKSLDEPPAVADATDDPPDAPPVDVFSDEALSLVEGEDDRLARKERDARLLALVSKAIAAAGPITTALPNVETMLGSLDRDRLASLASSLDRTAETFETLASRARDLRQNRPRLVKEAR